VGSSGRHRHSRGPKTLRISLIAATGLAVVAIVAAAVALGGSGSSSAQTRARAAPAPADSLRGPDRPSRDGSDAPTATPSASPSTPRASPAEKALIARNKRHRKVEEILLRGACEASFYGSGHMTASGEAFDPHALTAAHRSLPMGSKVRVTNRNNDRSVVVRINDRGPFVPGRCLDLSAAAMHAVGGVGSGVVPVSYAVLA
jgi:rare lipoprotein A